MLFPLVLKLCRTLWSVDMVCTEGREGCAGFRGEGPTVLVFRHTRLGKAAPVECRGGRAWYKWFRPPLLVLYCLVNIVYAEGLGREMVPSPFVVFKEGSSCLLLSGSSCQKSK